MTSIENIKENDQVINIKILSTLYNFQIYNKIFFKLYLGDRQIEIGEKILYKALLINPNHAGALDLIEKIKQGKEKTKALHGKNK